MPLEVGDTVADGAYRIERRLGTGAFGGTYQAIGRANQIVAIKEIYDTQGSNAIDEARRLCSVSPHRNLVRMLSVIDDRFLVMDLVRGRTLADTLREDGVFSPEHWWFHLRGLLEGVAHLHSSQLVHRDIKPDNIIVSGQGCVLVDFGAARPAGDLTTMIAAPRYAPPEFLKGGAMGMAGLPWDIYSLAVVSYEMLNGRVDDPSEMAAELASSGINYVRAIADGLKEDPNDRPSNIVNWICRMVAPDSLPYGRRETTSSGSDIDIDWQSSSDLPSTQADAVSTENHDIDSTDDSTRWDTRTLSGLRNQIVTAFSLPEKSIAFLSPDDGQIAFHTMVGTFCGRWTGRSRLDQPRAELPKNRFRTKTVSSLRSKVEDVYGLPQGSVTVLKPDRSRYSGNAQVVRVWRDYEGSR